MRKYERECSASASVVQVSRERQCSASASVVRVQGRACAKQGVQHTHTLTHSLTHTRAHEKSYEQRAGRVLGEFGPNVVDTGVAVGGWPDSELT
jgi:hypothetical protein